MIPEALNRRRSPLVKCFWREFLKYILLHHLLLSLVTAIQSTPKNLKQINETSSRSYLYFIPKMTKWNRQNNVTISFVILPDVSVTVALHSPCSGQVQPADGAAAWREVHGPARRGLPLLQAHAGQRAPRHSSHGDVACEEKIITQNG